MLALRPNCENCNKPLSPTSTEAMICTFECTFCTDCVQDVLHNVCPNCGGGFEKRPIRPTGVLAKHPASTDPVLKPVDQTVFRPLLDKNQNIPPEER